MNVILHNWIILECLDNTVLTSKLSDFMLKTKKNCFIIFLFKNKSKTPFPSFLLAIILLTCMWCVLKFSSKTCINILKREKPAAAA